MDELIRRIDEIYLKRALEVSLKGTCLRKKVGATLTTNPFRNFITIPWEENLRTIQDCVEKGLELDSYHVSSAFNTTVTGRNTCEDLGECLMHNGHCVRTLHAEIGCILNSNERQRKGSWIYISTAPCIKCFQEIVYSGIKRVIMEETSVWQTHKDFEKPIREMANEMGIEIWRKSERIV